MKALRLDLHGSNVATPLYGLVLLVVAIVAMVFVVRWLETAQNEGARLDMRENAIAERESERSAIHEAQRRGRNDDPLVVERMAKQAFAMEPARDLIERGWNANIALLRVEVVSQMRTITLDLQARSLSDFFDYVEWMGRQSGVEQVQLSQHRERPDGTVEAKLSVRWRVPYQLKALPASIAGGPPEGALEGVLSPDGPSRNSNQPVRAQERQP
jgi:hypothetical protein